MLATEVLNMPVADRNARLEKPIVRNADMRVVESALDKCKNHSDVLNIGEKLGKAGGWREEFELYHQAEFRFQDHRSAFQRAQQEMSTSKQIHRWTHYELGGLQRPSQRELLRIVEGV